MAENKDSSPTHEEIEKIADAEDEAGIVDQQSAAEKNVAPPPSSAPRKGS